MTLLAAFSGRRRLAFQHAQGEQLGLALDRACADYDVVVVELVEQESFFGVEHLASDALQDCDRGVSLLALDAHRSSVVDVQQVLLCNIWLRSSGVGASSQVSPVRAAQRPRSGRLDGFSGAELRRRRPANPLAARSPRAGRQRWVCLSALVETGMQAFVCFLGSSRLVETFGSSNSRSRPKTWTANCLQQGGC